MARRPILLILDRNSPPLFSFLHFIFFLLLLDRVELCAFLMEMEVEAELVLVVMMVNRQIVT